MRPPSNPGRKIGEIHEERGFSAHAEVWLGVGVVLGDVFMYAYMYIGYVCMYVMCIMPGDDDESIRSILGEFRS